MPGIKSKAVRLAYPKYSIIYLNYFLEILLNIPGIFAFNECTKDMPGFPYCVSG